MEPCPAPELLSQLLAENLGGAECVSVEAHLEHCLDCQRRLDELAGDLEPLHSLCGPDTSALSEVPDVLQRLKAAPPFPMTGKVVPGPTDAQTRTIAEPHAPVQTSSLRPAFPGYEVLEELGRGGMGVVYKARDLRLGRLVALKVIRDPGHASAEERARFRKEADVAALFQHPNVVQIHERGEHAGTSYLALEYVDGGSLQRYLAGNPQPALEAAALLEVLARAVHYAHGHGIVHRDLKPANVLLQGVGERGLGVGEKKRQEGVEVAASVFPPTPNLHSPTPIPKIADFGLAKQLASVGGTQTGMFLGTPSYVAPEQARGHEVTPATDVYALGAILYECLTGRPPFEAADALQTLDQVCTQEPVPPSRRVPRLSRDLETICLKCLHKEPHQRYHSALELAEDLERFRQGKPIRARPTPQLERLRKWTRRHPGIAVLMVSVVLSVAAGFLLVFWQWRRAEDRADAARTAGQQAETAREQADQKRREAEQAQAHMALDRGLTFCEEGDVGQGLLWLVRSLELAQRAGATGLERPIRINLADWSGQFSRPGQAFLSPSVLSCIAFSPDGKTLVSASQDSRVRVCDVGDSSTSLLSGLLSRSLDHPRPPNVARQIHDLLFLPDGKTLLTSCREGRVRFWDVASRRQVGQMISSPGGPIKSIILHPDGKRLVGLDVAGVIRQWDLQTRELLSGEIQLGKRGLDNLLALSPDGRTVAASTPDGRVRCWELDSGKALEGAFAHASRPVELAFSPDGSKLITALRDGNVHLWDWRNGLPSQLPAQDSEVVTLSFSPDGRLLLTATWEGFVRLWDLGTLRQIGPTWKHPSYVSGAVFHPDGKSIAIAEQDRIIRFHQMPELRYLGAPLRPAVAENASTDNRVHSFGFSPDGTRLLVSSYLGMRWYDATTGAPAGPVLGQGELVESMTLSPDGRTIAVGHRNPRGMELWDALTGKKRFVAHLREVPFTLALTPNGKTLVTQGVWANDPLLVWDVEAGKQVRALSFAQSVGVKTHCACFTPDGALLLLGCGDGKARFWDVVADREVGTPLVHASSVTALAFDRDGERILTGCRDGTVRLWDAIQRRALHEPLQHEGQVSSVAFSPDGRVLLTGSHDGSARFWDGATGKPLGPRLRHAKAICAVAFHPNGSYAITGSRDRTAQRWRVPAAPLAGDVNRVRLQIEALTGLELDERGTVRPRSPS